MDGKLLWQTKGMEAEGSWGLILNCNQEAEGGSRNGMHESWKLQSPSPRHDTLPSTRSHLLSFPKHGGPSIQMSRTTRDISHSTHHNCTKPLNKFKTENQRYRRKKTDNENHTALETEWGEQPYQSGLTLLTPPATANALTE